MDNVKRWLTEREFDTRSTSGPGGLTFVAPFAEVWDLLLAEVRRQARWTLIHADEEQGLLTIACKEPLQRSLHDLTVWVRLDENGLTCIDIRSASRGGRGDLGANRRRVRHLTELLERTLGTGARVRA